MRVAAYDPGESTGWATGDIVGKALENIQSGYGPFVLVAKDLYTVMHGDEPYDTVIYESWRLRKDKANEFIGSPILPIQAVGFTRAAVLFTHPSTNIVSQEPAIKHVIDKQMAGFGYPNYLPASDGAEHARDAVRHLWYYAVNKKGVRP